LAGLIALLSVQLRTVVVGVAPVLPELRSDLHLSFSATGGLTAIPVLGLGAAAVRGAIRVNRFGARPVPPPLPYSLYLWTAVLSLCVDVAEPGITVLVRS
jgi:cyanate permease